MLFHFDEAREAAEREVAVWLGSNAQIERALLVADLFGKLRLLLWSDADIDLKRVDVALTEHCGTWWSGEVHLVSALDSGTAKVYRQAWDAGRTVGNDPRLAIVDRHRNRTGWFIETPDPLWPVSDGGAPIIVFYSFKGGFGRTTALAALAIQRARAGERVCVIDFDLDSPGVGLLLNHDGQGGTARWGVVDFLLEHSIAGNLPLSDYYHPCSRVAESGEILVVPAGVVEESYVSKLARIDFDAAAITQQSGISALLHRIRDELRPDWILVDSRTGISEAAGQLLSGLAHLHVLLGTVQDQSWRGLNVVLDHLGRDRVLQERTQADVLLVHALVPSGEAGRLARSRFLGAAEREFTERYYADASNAASDNYWDMQDFDSRDAPHVPVHIEYDSRLASFSDISDIADVLCAEPYASFGERVMGRFAREAQNE